MTLDTAATEEVQQKAQETASTLVEQAQQVAQANVSTQKERAAETLGTVADAIRQSGEGMREQQPQIASLADQAAQRVESIATFVRDREVGDMIGEAERFARREPLMFLGGAFAVGFLAARFLKATSPESNGGKSGYAGSYSSDYYGYGYGQSQSATGGTDADSDRYGAAARLGDSTDFGESAGYGESGNVGSASLNGGLGTATPGWSPSQFATDAGDTGYAGAAATASTASTYDRGDMSSDGDTFEDTAYTDATQTSDRGETTDR